MDFLIRRTETGYEIDSHINETELEKTFAKIEEIRTQLYRLVHELEPKRKVMDLSVEFEEHWTKQNDGLRKLDPMIPASYRVTLSILDGGNIGKRTGEIVDETQLSHSHVLYHLNNASGDSEWYSQDESKIWSLTD